MHGVELIAKATVEREYNPYLNRVGRFYLETGGKKHFIGRGLLDKGLPEPLLESKTLLGYLYRRDLAKETEDGH